MGGGAYRYLSQQASGFTPILGLRKSEILKKKGFTLAEVLITLAIIGVVAALTIPTVVAKYQQKTYYTAFTKSYSILSNVIELAMVENGKPAIWSSEECYGGDCADLSDKIFAPFLKIAKTCDSSNYKECLGDELNPLGDGPEAKNVVDEFKDEALGDISRAYLLQDGSALLISYYMPWTDHESQPRCDMSLYVDTNGPKGPNKIGRDIFTFLVNDSKGTLSGGDSYTTETTSHVYSGKTVYYYKNCDPTEPNSSGSGCVDRLLLEGKMDY